METIGYYKPSMRQRFNGTVRTLGNKVYEGLGEFLTKDWTFAQAGGTLGFIGTPILESYFTLGSTNLPFMEDCLIRTIYAATNFPANVIEGVIGGLIGRGIGQDIDNFFARRKKKSILGAKGERENPYRF